MGRGLFWIVLGFIIGVGGAIIPVLGIPFVLIGAIMAVWGMMRFWFGAGKVAAKGAGNAIGVNGKKGTGRL